ncbi:MAG: hypothetical protein BGO41_06375 [Clostridiales bacterium 38-18]|nr:MAG: hypothetical protein BGO41_06375 [Clostridiales bacterium 38-18]
MKINQVAIGVNQTNNVGMDASIKNGEQKSQTQPLKQTERAQGSSTSKKNDKNGESNQIVDEEILQKSVEQANKSLEQYNRVIERAVHDKTHAVIYTVKDKVTGEVIQEFPSRKIQDMIAKMWELAGLFVDERA